METIIVGLAQAALIIGAVTAQFIRLEHRLTEIEVRLKFVEDAIRNGKTRA